MTEPSKNPGELPTYHGTCPYCASAVSCVTRYGMTYARCSHRGCGARGPYHRDLVRAVELFTRMDHPTRAHAASDDATSRFRSRADKCDPVEVPVLAAGVDAPRVDAVCRRCGGRRWVPNREGAITCPACKGTGRTEAAKGE